MSVKKMMAEATPLPWYQTEEFIPADAALIVYAVNHLPAYEAAVEALERLLAMFDSNIVGGALTMHASDCMTEAEGMIDGTISCTCGADDPLSDAEDSLRRLREGAES